MGRGILNRNPLEMSYNLLRIFTNIKNRQLIIVGGLGAPVTLGAVLSGALSPGRVSQGKVVPGEGPD